MDQIEELLIAGARRDALLRDDMTVIHQAASKKNPEVLSALLTNISDKERQALINSGTAIGNTPLMFAAEANNPATIRVLLSYGAKIDKLSIDGATPLIRAAYKGCKEAFDILMEKNANLNSSNNNGVSVLIGAVHSRKSSFLRHVIQLYRQRSLSIDQVFQSGSAIVQAVLIDAPEQVTVLLNEGAQRDYRYPNGETLIHHAARTGKIEVLKALLTVRISDQARPALIEAEDNQQKSPLIVAAANNQIAAIKLLLRYGANIEKRSNIREVALHYAAYGHPEATKVLLEAGANPNSSNGGGLTPIARAVLSYDLACAKLLLQHGALLNHNRYIAMVLRPTFAASIPKSDAMFHFLHSQGALLPVPPQFPIRPEAMERLARFHEQDAPYAAAIASGPAAVRALLATPGLRPLRWRDTRMAKHANNGTYELLLVKARADERLALYEANRRLFIAYFAGKIQDSNPHYKGSKGVRGDEDTLLMICALDKTHLPQYPHLTKTDIAQVKKALLNLKSNAETVAKWRAIQAHMSDSENEEYKIFRGAPEKIAELKARAAAESQRGDASRALLFSDSGKRAAASRPGAAAAARPAKQAKVMAEVDLEEAEKPPKGKRAKRKLS
jgi:ankyrin repeat protein